RTSPAMTEPLIEMASKLDAATARWVFGRVVTATLKTSSPDHVVFLNRVLRALPASDPGEARLAFQEVLRAVRTEKPQPAGRLVPLLGRTLMDLAAKLDATGARAAFAELTVALWQETRPDPIDALRAALPEVARAARPAGAREVIPSLIADIRKSEYRNRWWPFAAALKIAAGKLEPAAGPAAFAEIAAALRAESADPDRVSERSQRRDAGVGEQDVE